MNPILTSGDTFKDVVVRLLGYMNLLVWPLIGLAIVFFFWGLIRYIYKSGDAKGRALGRQTIIWGLIGLFVLFTLWGLVRLLQSAVFLGSPAQQLQQGTRPL